MKTDDLITLLAADPVPPAFSAPRIALRLLGTVAACAGLFLLAAGPRPDLAAKLVLPFVAAKTLLAALTCALALAAVLRLARPQARRGIALLLLPALIAAGLWLYGFTTRPPEVRFADVTLPAVAECLGLILLLSAIPAVVALRLVREGASIHPRLSAALAGLAAAAGAATGYSFFCTQDNPVFYVTWYGAAMLIVAGLSARFGADLLRW